MPATGSRGRGGRGPLPRNVQVSKKISWLLRHGAEKEGLELGPGGFINVQAVLANRNLRSLQVTFSELRQIVQDNDKQRFTMVPASSPDFATIEAASEALAAQQQQQPPLPSDDPKDYLIRANQGHSLPVEADGLLHPITPDSAPDTAVHGTTHAAWPLIVAAGGLKPMTRNHIHFAAGLPAGFTSLAATETEAGTGTDVETTATVEAAPVISGMRKSSTVLMFLDVRQALAAGIDLWLSDNGVILSAGDGEGILPLKFFRWVEDRTGEGILLRDGEITKDVAAKWATKGKGR